MTVLKKVDVELVNGPDPFVSPLSTFEKIIGQNTVVKKLNFYVNSHRANTSFPTMLFTGSHGLGKTYVAGLLAENLGRKFLEINCGTVSTTKDFVEDVLISKVLGSKPTTILLDEAHRLSSEVTTLLLSLLATNNNGYNLLDYKGLQIKFDLSKINTVLATTDSFKIFPPLVDRCETIYFQSYDNTEIIQMLKFYLPGVEFIDFSDSELEDLAYACRGRGRDAYALAQKIKRVCAGVKKFRKADWALLKTIFNVHPLGLNDQEVSLLRVIRIEGVVSAANIATRMMVREDNISDEIEIRPKELWLVSNTSRGRVLTAQGEDYFTNLLKETKQESESLVKRTI